MAQAQPEHPGQAGARRIKQAAARHRREDQTRRAAQGVPGVLFDSRACHQGFRQAGAGQQRARHGTGGGQHRFGTADLSGIGPGGHGARLPYEFFQRGGNRHRRRGVGLPAFERAIRRPAVHLALDQCDRFPARQGRRAVGPGAQDAIDGLVGQRVGAQARIEGGRLDLVSAHAGLAKNGNGPATATASSLRFE
jgi:hypothetical protein